MEQVRAREGRRIGAGVGGRTSMFTDYENTLRPTRKVRVLWQEQRAGPCTTRAKCKQEPVQDVWKGGKGPMGGGLSGTPALFLAQQRAAVVWQ